MLVKEQEELKVVLMFQVEEENHGDKKEQDVLDKVLQEHHIGIMVVGHLVTNQEIMKLNKTEKKEL